MNDQPSRSIFSRCLLLILGFIFIDSQALHAAEIVIHADQPGVSVSPTLYGAFFEDINRAGDGGIYGEMLQNRSFEDSGTPIAWTSLENSAAQFQIELDKTSPLNPKNPTSLKIHIDKIDGGRVGVSNQGFKGVPAGKAPDNSESWKNKFEAAQRLPADGLVVRQGKEYLLNLYARSDGFSGPLTVSLETQAGQKLATKVFAEVGSQWKQLSARLSPDTSNEDARLVISVDRRGTLWLDMVSLSPADTYQSQPNGFRPDLVEMMLNMHPGLLRFPGGSFSEGHILADAWRWKETIGDVAARPGTWNIWGYRSTSGMGFHEYLMLAEDLHAEPLYVAHVGMAEQGFVPLDQMEPWIQDTLDAVEYANGPITSKWGALRAQAGHPQPFNLKYVEIGNENGMGYSWGGGKRSDYLPRYKAFFDRLKTAYPKIVTIANIHTEPDVPADLVDEHYYEPSDWFFRAATMYDHYDRSKEKIYVGEYACKPDAGNGNLKAALAEAAFLTGLERNSDVVRMSSYAPLFTNPYWQEWKPDAIVFDNTRVFGTPSYYVQGLFAGNRPDIGLPLTLPASESEVPTLFAVAGKVNRTGDLILKVVNAAKSEDSLNIEIAGLSQSLSSGTCTELSSDSPIDENSFEQPTKIAPKISKVPAYRSGFTHTFPPLSVTVLRWAPGSG